MYVLNTTRSSSSWAILWLAALAVALICAAQASADPPAKDKKPAGKAAGKQPKSAPKGTTTDSSSSTSITTNTSTDVTISETIPATLDQALAAATENYSDVITAKAKVRLAEAELNSKRMEVAKKVVDLWGERRKQVELVSMARHTLANTREYLKGRGGVEIDRQIDTAQRTLIDAEVKLADVQSELRYLIRNPSPAVERGLDSVEPAKPIQVPRGPMVENICRALGTRTELKFPADTPIGDLVDWLKDYHKIVIQVDNLPGLRDMPMGSPLELQFVSLGAAVQLIDDVFPKLKLVIRDYGILVTTPERARQQGYMPLVDWARESAREAPATLAPPRESSAAEPKSPAKPADKDNPFSAP
jgi:hypothetical protein